MKERKENPLIDFLMVIKASGTARARIRTMVTKLLNKVEKLHLSSLQSHKTKIKILTYPGLAWSGFEQPGPGAMLLSLAKNTSDKFLKTVLRKYALKQF